MINCIKLFTTSNTLIVLFEITGLINDSKILITITMLIFKKQS